MKARMQQEVQLLQAVLLALLFFVNGTLAIKCYVCAPVPEIGSTCASPEDGILENCGDTTQFCHALFTQQTPGGALDITRNCGKFKGAVQAGNDECKDFNLANHKTATLCNCMTNGCNTQVKNLPAQPGTSVVAQLPVVHPVVPLKPTGDNKIPIYTQPTVQENKPKTGSSTLLRSGNYFVFCWLLACLVAF